MYVKCKIKNTRSCLKSSQISIGSENKNFVNDSIKTLKELSKKIKEQRDKEQRDQERYEREQIERRKQELIKQEWNNTR